MLTRPMWIAQNVQIRSTRLPCTCSLYVALDNGRTCNERECAMRCQCQALARSSTKRCRWRTDHRSPSAGKLTPLYTTNSMLDKEGKTQQLGNATNRIGCTPCRVMLRQAWARSSTKFSCVGPTAHQLQRGNTRIYRQRHAKQTKTRPPKHQGVSRVMTPIRGSG